MITNKGKTIISKYLVGQAPAYASHIALGVGAKPLGEQDSFGDYSGKNELDFEVLRIPITSRGYVYDEDGNSNIVFSGEIPGDQRYLFTEVGVFSARANPSAGTLDSRIVYTFGTSENWEYHNETSATSLPLITDPLDANAETGTIDNLLDENGDPVFAFRTNSNNDIFSSQVRSENFEPPRFLDTALILPGNMSYLDSNDGKLSVADAPPGEYYGTHIHLTGITADFDRNSSQDELKLAFSIIDKATGPSQEEQLGGVRIMIEFASSEVLNPDTFARFEVDIDTSDIIFTDNRYVVATKRLGDLTKSPAFSWRAVNSVKIYAHAYSSNSTEPSENFYIALDSLRFDNTTIQNPLYGMTGYTVVKTEDGLPIVKESSSSNIVEFRFGMDIQ